jgi:ABC-type polysaccharide/polyol phosphate export permease
MNSSRLFVADLGEAVRLSRVWLVLGWLDVRLRYRRTVLGPFWMILSFAAVACAMGYIYATLFRVAIADYLPYLIAGLAVWAFLQSMISEGATVFVGASSTILEHRLPLSLHVLRMLTRNTIVFAHSLTVVVLLALLFHVRYGTQALAIIPGIALLVLNGCWFGLLAGMLCTRYRDAAQVVQLLLQLVFFITPVFWRRDMLGARAFVADVNPIFHLIEIVRAPLLGQTAQPSSWIFVGAMTLAGWTITLIAGSIWFKRITYWL